MAEWYFLHQQSGDWPIALRKLPRAWDDHTEVIGLTVIAGPLAGVRRDFCEIEHEPFQIGRSVRSDHLRTPRGDLGSSRVHAVIGFGDDNFTLEDKSTAGTVVRRGTDDVSVHRATMALEDGDIVRVGTTRFRVSLPGLTPPVSELSALPPYPLRDLRMLDSDDSRDE